MDTRKGLVLGFAALVGLGTTTRYLQDRTTPQVEYETVSRVDEVEIRQYPATVIVETTASTENEAFRRLFQYISGENRSASEISMTAPVESETGETVDMTAPVESEAVSMTAPVETDRGSEGVRMTFYLPARYDYDSAPRPTDDSVRLIEQPGRTLAVLGFSWWTTNRRITIKTEELRSTLAESGDSFEVLGDPFLMRYEGPWVPPFLRTNEVAI
jgi:hypothetical protein